MSLHKHEGELPACILQNTRISHAIIIYHDNPLPNYVLRLRDRVI